MPCSTNQYHAVAHLTFNPQGHILCVGPIFENTGFWHPFLYCTLFDVSKVTDCQSIIKITSLVTQCKKKKLMLLWTNLIVTTGVTYFEYLFEA